MLQYLCNNVTFLNSIITQKRIIAMTQDAVQFLTEHYNELTDSEKKLTDYIISNIDSAIFMTVKTLASSSGVSVATVVRLTQHLGFDGYKDFRLYLASHNSIKRDFILDFEDKATDAKSQINKVLTASIDSIQLTLDTIDYETLEKSANLISNASRILFFGLGTSYIVCCDAMLKFQRVGKTVFTACDLHSATVILSSFKKNDLVIGISHSGKNKDTCSIMKLAKQLKIKTIALTTFLNSPICKYSDYLLYTKTRESPLHKIAITSRISQFSVIDALFMTYLVSNYDDCMKNIDCIFNNLNDMGIV